MVQGARSGVSFGPSTGETRTFVKPLTELRRDILAIAEAGIEAREADRLLEFSLSSCAEISDARHNLRLAANRPHHHGTNGYLRG